MRRHSGQTTCRHSGQTTCQHSGQTTIQCFPWQKSPTVYRLSVILLPYNQMTWQSVEELQQFLAQKVFHQSGAPRKAAGRALGTLVEIITFYLLKSWGLEHSTLIERRLPEYANKYSRPVRAKQNRDTPCNASIIRTDLPAYCVFDQNAATIFHRGSVSGTTPRIHCRDL